jgi:hypothetical protein
MERAYYFFADENNVCLRMQVNRMGKQFQAVRVSS